MNNQIVIIGAGLSGLAAAYFLEKAGVKDYLIVEQADKIGGLCSTQVHQGFYFDCAGHFLHVDAPWVRDLLYNLLGDNLTECVRQSRIRIGQHICRYPFQSNLYGMPPMMIKECLDGFVSARKQFGHPRPASTYPSFGAWIDQTLGYGIGRYFMHPYNAKLWGLPTYDMTTTWMKNYVPSTSLKDIQEGASSAPTRKEGYNATFLYPKQGGIAALPKAIFGCLQGEILLNCRVEAIDNAKHKISTSSGTFSYGKIIFTVSLPKVVTMLSRTPVEVSQAAAQARAAKVLCVNLGLSQPLPWTYSWLYFPEDKPAFYRLGSYSNIQPTLAPHGQSSLYLEANCQGRDAKSLAAQCIEDAQKLMLIPQEAHILACNIQVFNNAYVVYDRAHDAIRQILLDFLCSEGLHAVGRYARWEYADMEDSLTQAAQCVQTLFGLKV